MSDFSKNVIITLIAALLAFIFTVIAASIDRWLRRKSQRKSYIRNLLLELQAQQDLLGQLKTVHELQDIFDFILLNQVDAGLANLTQNKFKSDLLPTDEAQEALFEIINKTSILSSAMRSIEQFKNMENEKASSQGVAVLPSILEFIKDKKTNNISDLKDITNRIESLVKDLRKSL